MDADSARDIALIIAKQAEMSRYVDYIIGLSVATLSGVTLIGWTLVRVKELLQEIVNLSGKQQESSEKTARYINSVQHFVTELANRIGRLQGLPDVMPHIDPEGK